ncbi:hypothetical protein CMI37_05185 [Candidatus Pacearchaeota archaeon]|nr:hypothetical protein [Candidatus Pacearchaeota archaeon]
MEYIRPYDWDALQYFERDEFECKCGGQYCDDALPPIAEAHYFHLAWYFLNPLRRDINSACIINSAYRCPEHNRREGGKPRSYHTIPEDPRMQHPSAVDFYFPRKRLIIVESYVMRHTGNAKVHGYFYYADDNFIHLDFRGYKARGRS